MSKAFLYVENKFFGPLIRRALVTKRNGYQNFLIHTPFISRHHEILEKVEREELNGEKLFDHIVHTESFDLEVLRGIANEMETILPISGIATMVGLFTPDGLLGAHVASLAEDRGLPTQTNDALYRTNNKYLMRDALRTAGVPCVDFGMAVDEESAKEHASRIGYPVILKPVTGVASHLILKCRNEEELLSNFRLAMAKLPLAAYDVYTFPHSFPDKAGVMHHFDPLHSMLVEKYLDGREASVECVLTETEIVPLLVHDKVKVTEGARVVYEHLLVTPPVRFTDEECQEMKDYAVQALKAMGLKNSLSHVELRYDNELGPQILEINPRVGGMCVHDSLKAMCGFDALAAQINLSQGTFVLEGSYHESKTDIHAMFTIYPEHAGVFQAVSGIEEVEKLPGVEYAQLTVPVGTTINGDDEEVFLLMVWMKGESYEHIVETYEKACELVTFDIQRVQAAEEVTK
ncbi:MAG: ATP-grasp domain-containing protein [Tumebacillaceae bacterium]